MKPGNAGGGKGPQLKGDARSDEDGGIDVESNNPSKRSEVADGVARQSEGIARLSFLCLVRQGVPERRLGIRLSMTCRVPDYAEFFSIPRLEEIEPCSHSA